MIDIKEQFKEKYAEDIIQLKNLVENSEHFSFSLCTIAPSPTKIIVLS